MDFHVFSNGHPFDIYNRNDKVLDSVLLQIDSRMRIHKTLVQDKVGLGVADFVLYRTGKEILREPLGKETYQINKPGRYQAIAVVNGPQGEMIVSNILEFHIHPDGTETGSLIPEDSDKDGIPNYVEKSKGLNPDDPFDAKEDFDNDGIPNRFEVMSFNLRFGHPGMMHIEKIQDQEWFRKEH